MVRKGGDDEQSNDNNTGQFGDEPDQGRRSFMKLLGTTAVATGLGSAAIDTGAAASRDPFTHVKSVVLDGNYPRTTSQSDATSVVRSRSEFLDALGNASSGDVVFVPGDAQIGLGGAGPIDIPGGVTIASDRSVNGSAGGMLFTDEKELPLFRTAGQDVRLTGIRVRGNHPEGYHEFTGWNESASGIRVDHTGVEIDNCEIFGWGYAGINVNADGLHVHHCHVHANEEDGLGYGVNCSGGHTTIEFNYFLHNRHSIAGTGSSGYTARYNLIGPEADDHAFDMHEPGGNRIEIHHNKFEYSQTIHGSPIEAVKIRGVPNDICKIHDNWFHHDSPPGDSPVTEDGTVINQSGSDGEWQNLTFSSNYYGLETAPNYEQSLLEQNDPVVGSTSGSSGSSGDDSQDSPTSTFEIRSDENVSQVAYKFTASGEVAQASGDVENNDNVTDNGDGTWTATGSTGNGYPDIYQVGGDIVSFTASPEASVTLLLDGTDVTDDLTGSADSSTPSTFEIRTSAGSNKVTYEFTASGEVAQASGDVENNDNVTDNGDGTWTATGSTGNGYNDTYQISGDIVSFSASPVGSVTVYHDGTDVTDDLTGGGDGPTMTHSIRFESAQSGVESSYQLKVTDTIQPGPNNTLENVDSISGSEVSGTLAVGDTDVYHFAGDIRTLDFDGQMQVYVNELS